MVQNLAALAEKVHPSRMPKGSAMRGAQGGPASAVKCQDALGPDSFEGFHSREMFYLKKINQFDILNIILHYHLKFIHGFL